MIDLFLYLFKKEIIKLPSLVISPFEKSTKHRISSALHGDTFQLRHVKPIHYHEFDGGDGIPSASLPIVYKIGDKILVGSAELHQALTEKLSHRFMGSFTVAGKVQENAYSVDLPPEYHRTSSTFNVEH